MKPDQVWQAALGELQLQLTKSTYDTWLHDTVLLSQDDDVFVIGVESANAKDWLENRLHSTIKRTLTGICGKPTEARFVVQDDATQVENAEDTTESLSDITPVNLTEIDLAQTWAQVLSNMREVISARDHQHFCEMSLVRVEGDTLVVGVKDRGALDWLNSGGAMNAVSRVLRLIIGCAPPLRAEVSAAARDHITHWSDVGIPPMLLEKSLDNFDWSRPPVHKPTLRAFAEHWQEFFGEGKHLLLHGATGLGKSHLAVGLLKRASLAGWDVVFVDAPELATRLYQGLHSEARPERVLASFQDTRLLVLDDLNPHADSTSWREWSFALIAGLIRYRCQRSSPLIITTNDAPQELAARLSAPIARRLRENTVTFAFKGTSEANVNALALKERLQRLAE